jgi:peptidoglycan/xylan/chitin deacetylase (PgdA/CDA1 family)
MKQLSPWAGAFLRRFATLVAGSGRDSLLVLLFHRVLPQPDPMLTEEPDVADFAAQMDVVRATCSVIPLVEAVERLYKRSLPPNAACITFDDGYANTLTCAAPVLEKRGLPATVFITTGYLQGGRMWNDTVIESVRRAGEELDLTPIGLGRFELRNMSARRHAAQVLRRKLKYLDSEDRAQKTSRIAEIVGRELPEDLMLSAPQVKGLIRRGIGVGAHTVSHPILTRVDDVTARREIVASKATLEEVTGSRVELFAYPNGQPQRDYLRSHVDMVREAGFSAAVSSAWGACHAGSDRFQLPRMKPWETSSVGFVGRLLYTRRAKREETA